jgi:predicted nucleic acid-binding protein
MRSAKPIQMSSYVLDAFALIAFFQNEPGRARVEELFWNAANGVDELHATVVNVGEMMYRIRRRSGNTAASRALLRLDQMPIEIVDVGRDLALQASYAKAARRLGYLDCFVFALALGLGATVVTGDDDFQVVEDLVNIDWLSQPAR